MLRVYLSLVVVALAYPTAILLFTEQWAFGWAMVTGIFTVGVTVIVGVPLVVLCLHRGWLSPWHAGLGGFLAGLLCSSVFWFGGISEVAKIVIPFAVGGMLHGLAFWVLAFWRNTRTRPKVRNVA